MTGVFIDTNVLVYADQPGAAFHQIARRVLREHETKGDELWISRQVPREYLAVVTRPNPALPAEPVLTPSVAAEAARGFLRAYRIAEDSPTVTARLLSLIESFAVKGRQIHDANIVATMLAHELDRLVTFNAGDFRRFETLIEVEDGLAT